MIQQIEKLEAKLKEFKEIYENKQKLEYEKSKHRHFEKGDIVINGKDIVIVEWTENKIFNYEQGYFGGYIINGDMGFSTFKRDEFEIVIDEYFRKVHQVSIMLTGIEIEELKYSLSSKNCNQNRSKIKLLNCLDAIRYGSCVTEFRNL